MQERALPRSTAAQKRCKRTAEDDSGTTTVEENSLSKPDLRSDATSLHANGDRDPEQCLAPEYIVYTWVLCLVALATALKLYYLVKTTLASAMVSVFTTLILVAYKDIFDEG
jgi:adenylate cyclase 8